MTAPALAPPALAPPAPAPPEISVIVPLHDVGAHAGPCIRSLRAQVWQDFEAIVIDDGSTDGSGDRARAAAAGDARFHFVRQENQGLSAARNAGLERARGRLIAFLDGDDRFAPDFLGRMRAALVADGGDWVATGVLNCDPDGREVAHSAIHGHPLAAQKTDPDTAEAPRRWPLTEWPQILTHYPSAWNKLYRRALIGDLRFDVGTWFEDHAFYQQLACRSPYLLHLPAPLYLQTRGRAGQITTTDSDRIFEQFSVLDRLQAIMAASDRPGAAAGFAGLASRLIHERALVLRDPDRKARYLAAARGFLARHGLRFTAAGDPDISPSLGIVLEGGVPLSVVLSPCVAGFPSSARQSLALLATSLAALAAQDIAGIEVLVINPPGVWPAAELAALIAACPGVRVLEVPATGAAAGPAAWAAAAAAARGRFVVLASPGDGFEPLALRHWTDAALRCEVDLVFSAFRAPADGTYRDGWGNRAGLADAPAGLVGMALSLGPPGAQRLHPLLSAKLFARDLLRDCLAADPGPAQMGGLAAEALILMAEARAPQAVWIDFPGVQPALCPGGPGPAAILRDLAALARLPGAATLPPGWPPGWPKGWQRQIFARWVRGRFDLGFARDHRLGRLAAGWFLLRAGVAARCAGLSRQTGPLDAMITPRLRRLLGLAPPG